MARPRKLNARNTGVRIRFTKEEIAKLKEDAARRGMNVSEYIRTLTGIDKDVRSAD